MHFSTSDGPIATTRSHIIQPRKCMPVVTGPPLINPSHPPPPPELTFFHRRLFGSGEACQSLAADSEELKMALDFPVPERIEALRAARLPAKLVICCEKLYASGMLQKDSIGVLEFFAGVQTIVRAGRELGVPSAPSVS